MANSEYFDKAECTLNQWQQKPDVSRFFDQWRRGFTLTVGLDNKECEDK